MGNTDDAGFVERKNRFFVGLSRERRYLLEVDLVSAEVQ